MQVSAAVLDATARIAASASTSSSAVLDNDVVVVSGPAAALPTFREWLGGAGGVIESGTLGAEFSRPNWSLLFNPQSRWYYTNARVNSRTKTLVFDSTINLHYAGTQFLDHGAAGITDMYTSYNCFIDSPPFPVGPQNLQAKLKRLMAELDVQDGFNPSMYTSRWKNWTESFVNIYSEDPTPTRTFPPNQTWPWNAWFRMEMWMSRNNPIGSANGFYRLKCTRISDGFVPCDVQFTNVIWRGPGATLPHRYDCYQNYTGNAPDGTPPWPNEWGDSKINMEDIYSASHSSLMNGAAQVRAEIVNSAVYASATKHKLCFVEDIDGGANWSVRLNGPSGYFGSSDLRGLYLALFPASGTPTMRPL